MAIPPVDEVLKAPYIAATLADRWTLPVDDTYDGAEVWVVATGAMYVAVGGTWEAVGGGSSPLTTKGDLYTFSTVDARLAVGSNDLPLVADSAQTTGLKYAILTPPGGGTGAASFTAYAVLCGGTTSTGAFQSVASVGTSGQVLTSNGAGALPTFQATALVDDVGMQDFMLMGA